MTLSVTLPPAQGVGTVNVSAQGGAMAVSALGHVLVSGDGTFLVTGVVSVQGTHPVTIEGAIFASAQVSVVGNVAASVAGHVLVSGDGRFLIATSADVTIPTSVLGNVAASVAGTIDVSARQIDVSAHGLVSAGGHVLVSGDGTFTITGITSVQGNVAVSAAGHVLVSADGTIDVSGQGGAITTSARNVVTVSANTGIVNVSAQGGAITVSANTGTFRVREQGIASAAVTAQGGGYLVMGVDGASAARFMLTDTVGRQISVVSGGNIVASGDGSFQNFSRTQASSAFIEYAGAAEVGLLTSGGLGVFRDITHLSFSNNNNLATKIILCDASVGAGTTVAAYVIQGSAQSTRDLFFYPPLKQRAANRRWSVIANVSANCPIHVTYVENV